MTTRTVRRPDCIYWRDRLLRTKLDYQAANAVGDALAAGQPIIRTVQHEGRAYTVTIAVTAEPPLPATAAAA